MVRMERIQHLDGNQTCVLNEQILQIFPKVNHNVMHQSNARLYVFYRENGMPIRVLLKLAGVWQGCQYPQGFLEKNLMFLPQSPALLWVYVFSHSIAM